MLSDSGTTGSGNETSLRGVLRVLTTTVYSCGRGARVADLDLQREAISSVNSIT
jgi:hypothetical protein